MTCVVRWRRKRVLSSGISSHLILRRGGQNKHCQETQSHSQPQARPQAQSHSLAHAHSRRRRHSRRPRMHIHLHPHTPWYTPGAAYLKTVLGLTMGLRLCSTRIGVLWSSTCRGTPTACPGAL